MTVTRCTRIWTTHGGSVTTKRWDPALLNALLQRIDAPMVDVAAAAGIKDRMLRRWRDGSSVPPVEGLYLLFEAYPVCSDSEFNALAAQSRGYPGTVDREAWRQRDALARARSDAA